MGHAVKVSMHKHTYNSLRVPVHTRRRRVRCIRANAWMQGDFCSWTRMRFPGRYRSVFGAKGRVSGPICAIERAIRSLSGRV